MALLNLGKKGKAKAAIAMALEIAPDDDDVHAAKGWILLQDENLKVARCHLREALRINPDNTWAAACLASLESTSRRNKLTLFGVIAVASAASAAAIVHGDGGEQLFISAGLVVFAVACAVVAPPALNENALEALASWPQFYARGGPGIPGISCGLDMKLLGYWTVMEIEASGRPLSEPSCLHAREGVGP